MALPVPAFITSNAGAEELAFVAFILAAGPVPLVSEYKAGNVLMALLIRNDPATEPVPVDSPYKPTGASWPPRFELVVP